MPIPPEKFQEYRADQIRRFHLELEERGIRVPREILSHVNIALGNLIAEVYCDTLPEKPDTNH